MIHARSLYKLISKSGVNKCAACSTTSLELILFNVGLGKSKANISNPWKLALHSQSIKGPSSVYILPFRTKESFKSVV
jgi:hypothetical protein